MFMQFTNFILLDLQYARSFSRRNGFGPSIVYPALSDNEDTNVTKARKLYDLLSSFTPAEEAAIRQITPLLSIVRLAQGNIGTKGNTSCVWQESKMATILPNLPSECKFIVVTRQQQRGSRNLIRSTKFKRQKIQDCLEILCNTVEGVWKDKTISYNRLNQWPAEGDLLDLNDTLQIFERDDEGNVVDRTNDQRGSIELDTDGDDAGPAPLQNGVAPDETFEGVINMNESNISSGGNATLAAQHIRDAIETIQNEGEFSRNRESVTFAQQAILPRTSDFVNMNKTPYVWARAFPTVFIPVYTNWRGQMKWVIFNDITGSDGMREKDVPIQKWYNYTMWRSDGIPASHPTFSLILYNHKMRNSLQSQGRFTINTSDFDPTTTLDSIRNASRDDDLTTATEALLKRAHMHASNIPGTTPYWRSTRHEFKAINFFNSYINKKEVSLFHTGSLAEYHEYPLRHLLYKYTSALSHVSDEYSESILSDDAAFMDSVQKYKHIVTHYLASKMELWLGLFMKPVYNMDVSGLTKEFAKSRGAIHFHSLLHPSTSGDNISKQLSERLQTLALCINEAMKRLNSYIEDKYDVLTHENRFDTSPNLVFNASSGEKVREEFCSLTEEGKEQWNEYAQAKLNAIKITGDAIGKILESEYGYSALHLGSAPEDWVRPGGLREEGYRTTCDQMQKSTDVLDRMELKKIKASRENDLYQRQSNITNHCGTHKCSGYCLREKSFTVKYDAAIHADAKPEDRFFASDGVERVTIRISECRHRFGRALKYDSSGENNLTRGIAPQMNPSLNFDKNGQPKYVARRNHPRVLQQPYSFPWYGANNDTQHILVNATSTSTLSRLGSAENYEKHHCNLAAAGVQGLEHHTGVDMAEEYATSYACKGGENSANWESVSQTITEEYCSRPENGERSIRSLVGKHMNEISKNMSVTRDQSQFILGGGIMKRSSLGTPLKCSVSSIDVSDLCEGERVTNDSKFTWKNIEKKYKERSEEYDGENLYEFCALHWHASGPKPIQFFGFHDKATWPLEESYAKWMLIFFKPWRENIDTLKGDDNTFVSGLERFMYDPKFPARKLAEILRAKRNLGSIDVSEGADIQIGGADDITPTTDERRNAAIEDSVMNAVSPSAADDNHDVYEDMGETLFNNIETRIPPNFDWSENLDESKALWLSKFATNFYKEKNQSIIASNEEELVLFDEHLYRPENCRGRDQTFLIYHHLLVHYQMDLFKRGEIQNRPPSAFVLVEGLPGTGKSFVTKTLRNITRKIYGRNSADMASAPTGCAASLIGGSTHCRCSNIPTGRKFMKAPTNMTTSDATVIQATRLSMSKVIARFKDEHSMDGRPTWAWMKHRHEELRRPMDVLDDDGNIVGQDETGNSLLTPDVYMRPWGGIPFVYSFGDCGQLPPVMMKGMYDQSIGRPGTADFMGRIAFAEFRSPPKPEEATAVSVVMDEVLRQDDEAFKRLLTRMREGNIQNEDIDFLTSRCLDKLSPEERSSFTQNALHLVPTWKMAHQIIFDYLQSLDKPKAKFKAKLHTIRRDGTNHCVKETSYPLQNVLCVEAKVMLLRNFVVEYGLMNGSIGVVKDIVYENKEGPGRSLSELPLYVVVEFPLCNIGSDANGHCFPDKPATWIPIPVVTALCEKKCCTIQTIPLRVCIAVSIHKGQGMTVGPGKQFEKLIAYLPDAQSKSIPGVELVALSRAMNPECFAIGNPSSSLSQLGIKKIGTSPAYDMRRAFELDMKQSSSSTQAPIREEIRNLDPHHNKTFEGGCEFLLRWYRNNF